MPHRKHSRCGLLVHHPPSRFRMTCKRWHRDVGAITLRREKRQECEARRKPDPRKTRVVRHAQSWQLRLCCHGRLQPAATPLRCRTTNAARLRFERSDALVIGSSGRTGQDVGVSSCHFGKAHAVLWPPNAGHPVAQPCPTTPCAVALTRTTHASRRCSHVVNAWA